MKIAVIIPCRNEMNYIRECVGAIYNSDIDKQIDLTVSIVDGMSDDGTREIINQLQEIHPTLKLIDNKAQLTPFAFNLGIINNPGADYYQIIGARHIVSKNYLRRCVEVLTDHKEVWCAGGKLINQYLNKKSEVIAKAMGTSFGMGLGNFRTLDQSGYTDTVTSPMYPAWVFDKIGLFDEQLVRNQDDDFNFRVTKAGGKIYFLNDISLKYYVRSSFDNLWKQFNQYGYWKVFVNKKHKTITTIRQMIPPLFVAYCIIFPLTYIISFPFGIFLSIPFLLYLVLLTLISLKYAQNIREFFQFWIVFPILHLSYGLGYLKGIIHFILLNKKPAASYSTLSR